MAKHTKVVEVEDLTVDEHIEEIHDRYMDEIYDILMDAYEKIEVKVQDMSDEVREQYEGLGNGEETEYEE